MNLDISSKKRAPESRYNENIDVQETIKLPWGN